MTTEEAKMIHNQGRVDALASVLMTIRSEGLEGAAHSFADAMLEYDKDHPHAKWVKDNVPITPSSNNL